MFGVVNGFRCSGIVFAGSSAPPLLLFQPYDMQYRDLTPFFSNKKRLLILQYVSCEYGRLNALKFRYSSSIRSSRLVRVDSVRVSYDSRNRAIFREVPYARASNVCCARAQTHT